GRSTRQSELGTQFRTGNLGIRSPPISSPSRPGPLASGDDPLANLGRGLPTIGAIALRHRDRPQVHANVHPVQQWAGQPAQITATSLLGARAVFVARWSARARVG